jgi:hypothetical protein
MGLAPITPSVMRTGTPTLPVGESPKPCGPRYANLHPPPIPALVLL